MVIPSRTDAGFAVSRSRAGRAPLCTFEDVLWLLYLYPLRLISALTSPAWLYRAGKLANPFLQFQAREPRKRALRRILTLRPGVTRTEAVRIVRQSISNDMFRKLDDLILLRPSHRQMLRCTGIEGLQHLEQAIATGNGVILLTAHFCATRIAVRYLATLGYPALTVHNQKPWSPSEGRLGRILWPRYSELRRQGNPDVVYIQDAECSPKILRRLRSGGLVHIQFDALKAKTVVEGPFLGVPWRFPAGPFDFARLSGCAVVPMLCLGRSTGFQVRFSPMLDVKMVASREEFVDANLSAFKEVFERQIADYPEEWRLWTWG
jgi:Kdo2-lipid IVA lauroyltransferase/acyltransferase